MSIQIRLQLISESAPISNHEVQIGERRFMTDENGLVDLTIIEGQHQLSVQTESDLLRRKIIVDREKKHLIVDLTPRSTLEVVVERLLDDRYKLISVLGRGGMGVVFKAEDRVLNRTVAIKMLSGELEKNVQAQQIFLEEARALAPLVHPNLVGIHDILTVDAHTFMVLEYIVGQNLDGLIKKGPVDEMTTLRYVIQISRAVNFMHNKGFIHRDIKPGNAVVQDDGTLKLIDFGLARSIESINRNNSGVLGTPAYMAPEQITGAKLTKKLDVYQIGVTLYELLSGNLPFEGDLMYAHVHAVPKLLSDVQPDVSIEMSALVDRCISKDPDNRPKVDELMVTLQDLYLRGEDVSEAEISKVLYDRITKSKTTGAVPRATVAVDQVHDIRVKRNLLVPIVVLALVLLAGVILFAIMTDSSKSDQVTDIPTMGGDELIANKPDPDPTPDPTPTEVTEVIKTEKDKPNPEELTPISDPLPDTTNSISDSKPEPVKQVAKKRVVKKPAKKVDKPKVETKVEEQVDLEPKETPVVVEKPIEKKKPKKKPDDILIQDGPEKDDILLEHGSDDDILLD